MEPAYLSKLHSWKYDFTLVNSYISDVVNCRKVVGTKALTRYYVQFSSFTSVSSLEQTATRLMIIDSTGYRASHKNISYPLMTLINGTASNLMCRERKNVNFFIVKKNWHGIVQLMHNSEKKRIFTKRKISQ